MFSLFKTVLKNYNIKWTEIHNIHLTIVFLGDTEEKRVTEIDKLLTDISGRIRSFELRLSGTGLFKNIRDPRVIWAGIDKSEELSDLNRIITSKLRESGIHLEDRAFNPHLTMGRIKRINNISELAGLLEKHKYKEIQQLSVSELTLYESILRPEGPVYKPLGKYSLDGE